MTYGVLKSKRKGAIRGQCMATLSGKLLGGAIMHTDKFTVGNGREMPTSFHAPVVHHLTAKRLINDWQIGEGAKDVPGQKKRPIIQLSMDSGVISTHTAYVVVDVVHGKPIEGAMKT